MAKARPKKQRLTKSEPTQVPESLPAKHALLCAALVFLCGLALYARTLAPTVTLVDSGELILAAHSLGVAHPPGFPLYVLLAHLASIVPIGNVALRVNFASAFFAATAAGMMTLVVVEVLSLLSRPASKRARIATIISAGLLLAGSRTLWAYATVTEVYTLNTLFILTVIFLMLRWRRRIIEARVSQPKSKRSALPTVTKYDAWLYSAAIVFGLALGDHHVTVASILPGIAVLVYRTEGFRFFTSKRLLFAALLSFGALFVVYSYLPFAAARDPILNWGNPRSFSGVWRHLSGQQYQTYLSFDPAMLGKEFMSFARLLLREFGPNWLPLVLVLAVAGIVAMRKNERTIFWLAVLIVLVNAGYNLSYSIAEDKDAYYLPTFIVVVVLAATGLYSLGSWVSGKFAPTAILLVAIAVPASSLTANWRFDNRSRYFLATDYVDNIERTIAPNGLLLTLDWQVASPMLYTREIAGERRDIKVVDINLLRRSWYFDYLERAYPEMIARSRAEVDAFLTDLKHWENDPAAYAASPALTQQISTRFTALCEVLVRHESAVAPVYFTNEVLFAPGPETIAFAKWLGANYGIVPKGLTFELTNDQTFHDPGELVLNTRGLADDTLHFDNDDVVRQKVLPAYATMLVNRGRYLAAFHQEARAVDAFQRALDLDPNLKLAREGLKSSLAKLPK